MVCGEEGCGAGRCAVYSGAVGGTVGAVATGGPGTTPDAPAFHGGLPAPPFIAVVKSDDVVTKQSARQPSRRPPFSWDKLPVFFHSANASGPWSAAAAKQIARFAMATNEKNHGSECDSFFRSLSHKSDLKLGEHSDARRRYAAE